MRDSAAMADVGSGEARTWTPGRSGVLPQVEIARATLRKSRQLMTKRPLPVPPERDLRGISSTSRAGPPVLSVNESTPMHMLVCGKATSGSIPQRF